MKDDKLTNPYLLQVDDLSYDDIFKIYRKADFFLKNYKPGIKLEDLKGITIALAFFENSTRTKLSFDLASKRLSAETLNFQSSTSSLSKGESLIDTLRTIEAMGVQIFIIRHNCSGSPQFLQSNTNGIVINAGDGKHEHPTQALLDTYTMYKHFGKIEKLKVAIVGDILHSRVARSNVTMLKILGAEVAFCAPGTLLPKGIDSWNVKLINNINDAVDWADVVMMLRLQRERMSSGILPSVREFSKYFGMTYKAFSRKPGLVLMHPGPVNYGIEIEYELSFYPNVLIQTQVTHGVLIRMALLSLLSKHLK